MDLDKLSTPKEILLTDPISNSTKIIKRNLLFFSSIVLVGVVYGSKSIHIPITDIPSNSLLGVIGFVVLFHIISFSISYVTDVQGWHLAYRNTIGEEHLSSIKHLASRMSEIDNEFVSLRSNLDANKQVYTERMDALSKELTAHLNNTENSGDLFHLISQTLEAINGSEMAIADMGKEISKSHNGYYADKVENMSGILKYFKEDALRYRNLEALIQRESLQLRITQYIRIYGWSGLMPVSVGIFAAIKDYEHIATFMTLLF